jgi:hypothetical protein
MTLQRKGIVLLVVQVALVLSVAVSFAWERHTYARVWTRVAPIPPVRELRGHYLDVNLIVDACSLPRDRSHASQMLWKDAKETNTALGWRWSAATQAKNGTLTAVPLGSAYPDDTQQAVLLKAGKPCNLAEFDFATAFYLPHPQLPGLAPGEQLWAEVTVPPSGPPRPIQLAISDGKNFRVLDLR